MTSTSPRPRKDNTAVSTRIVEKVAALEGVGPTELPILTEVVDTDALNAIFASSGLGQSEESGRIEFTYCGYEIVVHGSEVVTVKNDSASPEVDESSQVSS